MLWLASCTKSQNPNSKGSLNYTGKHCSIILFYLTLLKKVKSNKVGFTSKNTKWRLQLFDSHLTSLSYLVSGPWAFCLGPRVNDASNSHCLNISLHVSILIKVCHFYWFSKSLMLVKELITWIVALLPPAPAAGSPERPHHFPSIPG